VVPKDIAFSDARLSCLIFPPPAQRAIRVSDSRGGTGPIQSKVCSPSPCEGAISVTLGARRLQELNLPLG
jgi:hypothetical protein